MRDNPDFSSKEQNLSLAKETNPLNHQVLVPILVFLRDLLQSPETCQASNSLPSLKVLSNRQRLRRTVAKKNTQICQHTNLLFSFLALTFNRLGHFYYCHLMISAILIELWYSLCICIKARSMFLSKGI